MHHRPLSSHGVALARLLLCVLLLLQSSLVGAAPRPAEAAVPAHPSALPPRVSPALPAPASSPRARAASAASPVCPPAGCLHFVPVLYGGAAPAPVADTGSPSAPSNLRATASTTTTIGLAWGAASDDVGVAGYAVHLGATTALSTTATTATLRGLAPATAYRITVAAYDAAGNVSPLSAPLLISTAPAPAPYLAAPSNLRVTGTTHGSASIAWDPPAGDGPVASYDIFCDGTWIAATGATTYTLRGLEPANSYLLSVRAAGSSGGYSDTSEPARAITQARPDPAAQAPALDGTTASEIAGDTAFLYTGEDPQQVGVAPGAIDPRRAAVLRGRAIARDGTPLAGVRVGVLGHAEYGATWTRADGMFDLAVGGGEPLIVDYAKRGYLPAQRTIDAPWRDYAALPDVALVEPDPAVAEIALDGRSPLQVAAGGPVSDADGERQAVLVFPARATATAVYPGGETRPLETLHVRATEYTLGPRGQAAMPGSLPANVGYTYAAEFSVDEAIETGAVEVRFSQPAIAYVENFLGFPVGGDVPAGSYDRQRGAWVAADNGRVVEILGASGGRATLDLDGDGAADDPATLGISDAERAMLAERYPAGRQLWRVPIPHFSPWDFK